MQYAPAELAVVLRILEATARLDFDYFACAASTLVFADGRRDFRILVEPAKVTQVEADAMLFVERSRATSAIDADVFRRVAFKVGDDHG